MLEFNGYLTGPAEKYTYRRSLKYAVGVLLSGFIMFFPVVILFSIKLQKLSIFICYCSVIAAVLIMFAIRAVKDRKNCTPKKIYINKETIVAVSDKYTVSKFINDIKEIRDYGEFYSVVFSFGNLSELFVCQKDLLTKGTLEEFETLFEDKIVKKTGDG